MAQCQVCKTSGSNLRRCRKCFHSFKAEAVQGDKFGSCMAMCETMFEYIEVYYNRQRLHSSLGYMSPVQFEASEVA